MLCAHGLYVTYCWTYFPSLSAWRSSHKGQLMAIWHNQALNCPKLRQIMNMRPTHIIRFITAPLPCHVVLNPTNSGWFGNWKIFIELVTILKKGLKESFIEFCAFVSFIYIKLNKFDLKPNWIWADCIGGLPSAEIPIWMLLLLASSPGLIRYKLMWR